MSKDFRAKSQIREDRLEREHNDPTPTYFEECSGYGRCDKLTEPTQDEKGGDICSECGLTYGQNGDETVEALQNRIAELEAKLKDPFQLNFHLIDDTRIGLEKKNEEQAAEIAELKAKLGAVLPEGYPCTLPGSNDVYWVIQAMNPEGVPRYLNYSHGRWERAGILGCAERFRNPKEAKKTLLSLRNDFRNNGLTDTTERISRVRNLTHWKITEVVERGFYKPMDPELLEWCVRVGRDISELLGTATKTCVVCKEKPSLRKSLSCADCVEGGEK